MYRTATVLLVSVVVIIGAGAGPRSPAARVLVLKGKATIVEGEGYGRPAAVYGTIYANDRLEVAKDSEVTLVFREDGHVERIIAAGTFKVSPKGCQPQTGVERLTMPDQDRATIVQISKDKRGRPGIVKGGVVMVRSPAPPPRDAAGTPPEAEGPTMAQIRPIAGSRVLETKPTFSWPTVLKAEKYTLSLYRAGNRVWSADSETPQLAYAGETPLKPGALYSWEITATIAGKPVTVFEGAFHTASDDQLTEAAALKKLLATPEAFYLAAAALWYEQNDLVIEAIAANEQLAKKENDATIYRVLGELYIRAGREKDADAAMAKADELEGAAGAAGER